MAFKEFLDLTTPVALTIGGKVYTLPRVSAEGGIRYKLSVEAKGDDAVPLSDVEFEEIFLGPVKQEMIADNVPDEAISRALATAVANHSGGRDLAEIMWETGGDPKAVAQLVKDRMPNRASRRSTSTGKAKRTR